MTKMTREQAELVSQIMVTCIQFVKVVWDSGETEDELVSRGANLLQTIESEYDNLGR